MFTTRQGGVSRQPFDSLNLGPHVTDDPAAVCANRLLAATSLGIDPAAVSWMAQVHGCGVTVVSEPLGGDADARVDAQVTAAPRTALAVLVADCVPVLVADADGGVIAAAHAGRRGLAQGIVAATVAEMTTLGAVPERLTALLGPAIGGCCYELPRELRDEVAAVVPAAAATTRAGTPALDLRAGVRSQLAALGVVDVRFIGGCTAEDPALFSYRRDGRTGRFAGYVWRT